MPTAVVSQSFAKAFQADEGFTASTVSFDTLVSMVTVPLLILLIG
jgi:predicted permease